MIQKCTNCGTWCKTKEEGMIDRGLGEIIEGMDQGIRAGGKYLGTTGEIFGGSFGAANGLINGITKAIFGKKFNFVCPKCGNSWSTDDESEDQTKQYKQECMILSLIGNCSKYRNESEEVKQGYIDSLINALNELDENQNELKANLYDALAYSYFFLLRNSKDALIYIDKSLDLYEDSNSMALRGVIRGEGKTPMENYKKAQEIIRYKENEVQSPYLTKDEFESYAKDAEAKYAEHFLEIPYHQRKFLVVTSDFNDLPDNIKVLSPPLLPVGIQFPVGHPINNTLYVCHPYDNNSYLPFDNYELELFNEELKEFLEFLIALGAKKIEVIDVRDKETENGSSQAIEGNIGGSYNGIGAEAGGASNSTKDAYEKLKKKYQTAISVEQLYSPHVPEHLIWYKHRKEWQRLAREREQGVLTFEEEITSTQKVYTSQNEMQKINAEFQHLLASVKANGEHAKENILKKSEYYSWTIRVDFYPMSSYVQKQPVKAVKVQVKEGKKQMRLVYLLIGFIALLVFVICLLLL